MEQKTPCRSSPVDSKLQDKNRKSKKVDRLCNDLAEILSGPALDFVVCQVQQAKRKKHGRRWNCKDKALALSLFHSSPRTYKLLQKVFNLPSIKTLKRVLSNVNVQPGFNKQILEALKHKVSSMSDWNKLCVIAMDEMSIKQCLNYNAKTDEIEGFEDFGNLGRTKYIANHAIAFMVRGLVGKWKQPVGYFLSSGPMSGSTMKSLLFQCIEKLTGIGLTVKAVICDQGSNNRNLFESGLNVSILKPYFIVLEQKVYLLYDPPHLVKNVRNNLRKHGFIVDGKAVSWDYIKSFWEADSKLPIRMAPRLTFRHINLPPFAPLRVKLATQVLSHSVASGISTYCHFQALPPEAQYTADFCEKMDQLFNCFNSSSMRSNAKMRHAITTNSGHKKFLTDCLDWFSTIRSQGPRTNLPCVSGWKLAISSLLQLWDELHTNYGLPYLLTNRLNQDCVENLFSIIHGKGGHRDNPDPC